MPLPILNRSQLIDISAQEDIIKATANQIIKDFAEFGLDIEFSGNTANFYDELYGQMESHVANFIENQYSRFLSFLYRIDISNKEIELYKKEMPNSKLSDVMTELIIHREIKKVLYRTYYSNKPTSNTDTND